MIFFPPQGQKVVTPHEMTRVEGLAYAEGVSEEQFMENAGNAIADRLEKWVTDAKYPKRVTLFVGKGNNGGDAYVAGRKLIEKGFTVLACHVFSLESCGPLCRKQHERFKSLGGDVHFVREEKQMKHLPESVILDGLVGTGFKGKAEGVLADAIEYANRALLPKIAIDIPSGLNGTSGKVESVAIQADETIFLGLPKIGFFIENGWDYVGKLFFADFGLHEKYVEQAKAEALLIDRKSLTPLIPHIRRTRHKYDRGYVLALAGSPGMSGAASLATLSALRCGSGIVRLFFPEGMQGEMSRIALEIVKEEIDLKKEEKILTEAKRADSIFIGPGMGRASVVRKLLQSLLPKLPIPCVVDADALYHLAENPQWKLPRECILTPHHQEMRRLLPSSAEGLLHGAVQKYVDDKDIVLVLKGAPTFVFQKKALPYIVPFGDPGMATAGTGDVLTGMLAALLSEKLPLISAAVLGVSLHALSGEMAALEKTSHCMIASDLIEFLPRVFTSLCDKNLNTSR